MDTGYGTATSDEGGEIRVPDRASRLGAAVAAFLLLPALTGCEDGTLTPPEADAGERFDRYVAIGNSITAGFQSGGINDSTQLRSYAAFLAEAMGTEFETPRLNRPGCPPPLVNVFTGERVGGGSATDCALRTRPIPPVLNNVAVPGAQVIDVLSNVGPETNANALTTLLLGGRTQLEAAARVEPTFASVWIGNNDVLGAALAGDPSLITPAADFQGRLASVLDSLESVGAQGMEGVLVGVANVALIPHLSPGAAYWQAEQQGAFPPNYEVNDNCAPEDFGGVGEETLVPFRYGFGVLLARAQEGEFVELDCVNDPPVLTGPEVQQVVGAVLAYNAAIQNEADERGWAFFDPNPALAALRAQGEIPLFPNTSGTDAVVRPFGDFFSRDGVHPSTTTHRIVADSLASAINQQFGTSLPVGGS